MLDANSHHQLLTVFSYCCQILKRVLGSHKFMSHILFMKTKSIKCWLISLDYYSWKSCLHFWLAYTLLFLQLTLRRTMDTAKQVTQSGNLNEFSMVLLNNTLSLPLGLLLSFFFNEIDYLYQTWVPILYLLSMEIDMCHLKTKWLAVLYICAGHFWDYQVSGW